MKPTKKRSCWMRVLEDGRQLVDLSPAISDPARSAGRGRPADRGRNQSALHGLPGDGDRGALVAPAARVDAIRSEIPTSKSPCNCARCCGWPISAACSLSAGRRLGFGVAHGGRDRFDERDLGRVEPQLLQPCVVRASPVDARAGVAPVIYRVLHTTEYHYSEPVPLCHNVIRLRPRDTPRQVCRDCELIIDPVPAVRRDLVDFFGNHMTWVSLQEPHEVLKIEVKSEVAVTA